jgi:7-cyano-7-deazaguanine reductase
MNDVTQSHLGRETIYPDAYDPSQLFPVARALGRSDLGLADALPFHGYDLWNAFEVSWLNARGKPEVAILETKVPATSPFLIESKSFKLYLNSLNSTQFDSTDKVRQAIARDLSEAAGARVSIELFSLDNYQIQLKSTPGGECIDALDIQCELKQGHATHLLKTSDATVTEKLFSNLLKSNCPVTNQPDWGTVVIEYTGQQIDQAGLLGYIVSFRTHNEFHEQCVERIFTDITKYCKPEHLTVYAHYTRRGGLDINPVRTSEKSSNIERYRLIRQ